MLSWLTEPFQQVTVWNVGLLWLILLVIEMAASTVLQKFGYLQDLQIEEFLDNHSLGYLIAAVGVFAPVMEEMIFRIIPILVAVEFGFSIEPVVLIGTMAWVLMHGRRAVIVAIGSILYIKLALGMFLLPLIIMHVFNNVTMVVLYKVHKRYIS